MISTARRATASAALGLVLATLVGALAAPASAAKKPRFVASLYGIQRHDVVSKTDPPPDPTCFSRYSTHWEKSSLRFSTSKPIRVSLGGHRVTALTPTRSGHDFDLKGTYQAAGDETGEEWVCAPDKYGYEPIPPPDTNTCEATELPLLGMSLSFPTARRIVARGEAIVSSESNPLADCMWGDLSLVLYEAKASFDVRPLLDGEAKEMQFILRGRDRSTFDEGSGHSSYEDKTTVYLTIRRVR
ncbi:MAG TPA: hypothetical protein VFR97_15570 [Capillimicrobium sp.]|nr:hypothetical protein [Capillimicrobium sp.]